MASLPWPGGAPLPDFGITIDTDVKVLENQFGDGYTQRAADGINSIRDNARVEWKNVTTAEKDALLGVFVSAGGWQTIELTFPGDGAARHFTVKPWGRVPVSAGYWNVSATFREEFSES